jgi:mannose-1-phosphate guanylyltransferase
MPKCLLPVCGVPILQIWLEACQYFGIGEVLINIHAHAEQVRRFLQDHASRTRVYVVEEEALLGSAGTLLANRDWVRSEEFFWVFYADVLNRVDLSAMLQVHQSRNPAATLGVYRVPDPTRCGIVDVGPDGTIRDFVEKPSAPRSNLAFAGLLIGTPKLIEQIPLIQPTDIGFDVLPLLAGKMIAYPISEYLLDIGTKENYALAQTTWPGLRDNSASL